MNFKSSDSFDIPILMLVFNRPQQTLEVLKRVLEINPSKIYVVADGSRVHNALDKKNTKATRDLFDHLPSSVEVIKLFRTENLGCKNSVSEGISWFFEHEEMGIILEDDCLPDLSFFSFTRELLIKYQYENRIMHIGGDNFQNGKSRTDASYYFSKLPHIWGWATWRRAWNGYSSSLENFSEKELKTILDQLFSNWNQKQVFIDKFELLKLNKINTWDYQWMFHVWRKNGLAIIPNVNLVKNIGFGENATHTSEKNNLFANLETSSLNKIIYNDVFEVNTEADLYSYKKYWFKPFANNLYRLLKRKWLKFTAS